MSDKTDEVFFPDEGPEEPPKEPEVRLGPSPVRLGPNALSEPQLEDLRTEVLKALKALEPNIPKALSDLGVRGAIARIHECPVVVYLSQVLPWVRDAGWVLSTGYDSIWVSKGVAGHIGTLENILATPGTTAQFMRDFDKGAHPELKA